MAMQISRESAEAQLRTFAEFYDVDPIKAFDNPDMPGAALMVYDMLVERIMRGQIEITEGGKGGITVKQYLKCPPEGCESPVIEYKIVTAGHKKVMDAYKAHEHNKRMQAFMGALSGLGPEGIARLIGPDIKAMEILAGLFLQA